MDQYIAGVKREEGLYPKREGTPFKSLRERNPISICHQLLLHLNLGVYRGEPSQVTPEFNLYRDPH